MIWRINARRKEGLHYRGYDVGFHYKTAAAPQIRHRRGQSGDQRAGPRIDIYVMVDGRKSQWSPHGQRIHPTTCPRHDHFQDLETDWELVSTAPNRVNVVISLLLMRAASTSAVRRVRTARHALWRVSQHGWDNITLMFTIPAYRTRFPIGFGQFHAHLLVREVPVRPRSPHRDRSEHLMIISSDEGAA